MCGRQGCKGCENCQERTEPKAPEVVGRTYPANRKATARGELLERVDHKARKKMLKAAGVEVDTKELKQDNAAYRKQSEQVRCAFSDRNLHSRIPLVPTPARLMGACL